MARGGGSGDGENVFAVAEGEEACDGGWERPSRLLLMVTAAMSGEEGGRQRRQGRGYMYACKKLLCVRSGDDFHPTRQWSRSSRVPTIDQRRCTLTPLTTR